MSDDLTPRERLNAAIALVHGRLCGTDGPFHCSQCTATRVALDALGEITAWIRENRGRLHRPTCLDGNGCRCGLGDLPMWGGADVPELPEGGAPVAALGSGETSTAAGFDVLAKERQWGEREPQGDAL